MARRTNRNGFLRRWLRRALFFLLACYLFAALALVAFRWINPPTTAVQAQRRVEAWLQKRDYRKRRHFAPLARIAPALRNAVVAAEDGRFFDHHGFDWRQIRIAITEDREEGRLRGASTITQQLVKNLLLTTRGGVFRKAAEFTLVPVAETVLSKQRILELYLNVIEWGPGVYGAEAAALYHYKLPAARLNRDQAARLAAILPSPLRRRPARMNASSAAIQERMQQMGF